MNLLTPSQALLILAGSFAVASGSSAADRVVERSKTTTGFAWVTSLEGTRSTACSAIATTKGGAVVAGQFAGELKSGGRKLLQNFGRSDGFVAAISDSGKVLWQVAVGGDGNDQLRAMATDPDGNVYVTGFVSGAAKNDSGALPASAAGADAFLLKLSSKGEILWTHRLAGPFADSGEAVSIGGDGTVFWGGHFQGDARLLHDAKTPVISSDGGNDAFVAAFDPQGRAKWLHSFGSKQADEVTGLAADGNGGVFVTGSYESLFPLRRETGIDFLRGKGGIDAFLMRLDDRGQLDWARSISGPQQEQPVAIALAGDQLLLAGNFQDRLQVNPTTTLESAGVFDGFISSWTMQGELAWARRFGGAEAVTLQALHVGRGRIDAVGSFKGTLDFGSDAGITAIESASVTPFMATIDTSGRWLSVREGADGENADFLGVTRSAAGDVLVCGVSKGELIASDGSRHGDERREPFAANRLGAEESDQSDANGKLVGTPDKNMAEQTKKKGKKRPVAFVARLRE